MMTPQNSEPQPAWCIYVGQQGTTNFTIGRNAGTWGVNRPEKLEGVSQGDRVIFVERLNGYGRKSREVFFNDIEKASTILVGTVTSDVYETDEPLWPDGAYPYRFSFREDAVVHDTRLLEVATPDIIEAIRMSGINQGAARYAEDARLSFVDPIKERDSRIPTIEDLAEIAFMDVGELREIESLLREKRQLVLEGPPGSGKTFVAEKFARYFTGNKLDGMTDDAVEIVQFHQSYSYEDFVQGIRPITGKDGSLYYQVQAGIFMEFCDRAADNPDRRYVLIIDEINRGNLSRVFGEVLFLLEYRDQRIRLPYGEMPDRSDPFHFAIPHNVFIVGTMNSTDRSLALIDYAMRRRFYFYRLMPVTNGRAPVLENWLVDQGYSADIRERIINLFIRLNLQIQEYLPDDFQVGHSYFMVDDIDEEKLERIWRRAVIPLLAEYFHNSRDASEAIERFRFEEMAS